MNRMLPIAFACWLVANTLHAAPADPSRLQNEAYVNLVQADQSLDAGQLEQALSQYRLARDAYLQLLQDFPEWEPRIAQSRKTYCDQQIADIEQRAANPPADAAPAGESPPPASPVPEPIPAESAESPAPESAPADVSAADVSAAETDSPREESGPGPQLEQPPNNAEAASLPAERSDKNKKRRSADKDQAALRKQLDKAEESLRRLQDELTAKDGQIKETDAARAAEIEQLQTRISGFEAERAETGSTQNAQQALADENAALRKELDDAKQRIDKPRRDENGAPLRALRTELADTAKKLRATDKDNRQLRKKLDKAEASLLRIQSERAEQDGKIKETDAARAAEIDQLKARIAGLEAEQAQPESVLKAQLALTAENESLRKELDDAKTSLQSLRTDLDVQTDETKVLEESTRQLRDQQGKDQDGLRDLRDQLAAKDQQMDNLRKELDRRKNLDSAIQLAEKESARLRGEIDRLNRRIADLEAALQASEFRAGLADTKARQAEAKRKEAEQALAQAGAGSTPASIGPNPSDAVRSLMQSGNDRAALAAVREARRASPDNLDLALLEGTSLIRLRLYPEAVSLLSGLAQKNPRKAEIHAALGAAQIGIGSYEEARTTLLESVRLDNNLPESHFNLAQIYARIEPKNLAQARKCYQQALELGLAPNERFEQALK
ncbi:MAG: hypothetical protein EOM72_05105 [Opitutae bacterium]|nr:hypothetical protein [Opitutae bacterium]